MTQISHALAAKMGARKLSAHPILRCSPALKRPSLNRQEEQERRISFTTLLSLDAYSMPFDVTRCLESPRFARDVSRGPGRTGRCSLTHASRFGRRRLQSCLQRTPILLLRPLGRTGRVQSRNEQSAQTGSSPTRPAEVTRPPRRPEDNPHTRLAQRRSTTE